MNDNSIRYRVPGSTEWQILDGNGYRIDSANGKVILISMEKKVVYRNVQN